MITICRQNARKCHAYDKHPADQIGNDPKPTIGAQEQKPGPAVEVKMPVKDVTELLLSSVCSYGVQTL